MKSGAPCTKVAATERYRAEPTRRNNEYEIYDRVLGRVACVVYDVHLVDKVLASLNAS